MDQTPTKQIQTVEEQVLTFSGTTPTLFIPDGGYFQFKDEKEVQKFVVWLKELEEQHKNEISQAQQEAVERVTFDTISPKWIMDDPAWTLVAIKTEKWFGKQ